MRHFTHHNRYLCDYLYADIKAKTDFGTKSKTKKIAN